MKNPTPGRPGGFWQPSPWYLAQVVHVLAGAAVLLAAHVRGWNVYTSVAIFLAVAAFKEFAIDTSPFEKDSWLGSAQDFAAYAAGACAGLVAGFAFWEGAALAGGTILILFVTDLVRNADWSLPYD